MNSTLTALFVGIMIANVAQAADAPPRHTQLTAIELMANDKEEHSIIVRSSDVQNAEASLGDLPSLKPKLTELALALAPKIFDPATPACELDILTQFKTLASAQGFSTQSQDDLKAVLVSLRELDLIDDVILAPLWKALPAFTRTPALPAPAVSTPASPASASSASSTAPTESADLIRAKSLFLGLDRMCPTQALASLVQKLKKDLGNHYKVSKLRKEVKKALELNVITPELSQWMNDLEDERWEEVPFTLTTIAQNLMAVKNTYLPQDKTSGKTVLASQKKKKTHGLSYRLAFYQKYNATQIDLLAKAFYKFNRNVGASRVSIVADYNGDGTDVETERLSDTEQYRWAENRLHKEYADIMARSDIFQGLQIDFEDIVIAGLETGYVPSDTLNSVMAIDDRWNPPEETGFKKVMNIVQKYGGPLLILVPPPFNMISSVVMTLAQSTVLKKKERPNPRDEGYSIF